MIIKEAVNLIRSSESCKLEAYECPTSLMLPKSQKFWTIGWGNTTYENGSKVKKYDKITQERADQLADAMLERFETEVMELIKVPINEYQKGALVSFAYNCGVGSLKSSTLLKLLNEGKLTEAANEFLKWNKAQGKVLPGLTKRRQKEREMFLK